MSNPHFIPFPINLLLTQSHLPEKFNNPFETSTPEICRLAVAQLQKYLEENMHLWTHNFGLENEVGEADKGKMFGVLVVQTENQEIGYLATYSGKLEGEKEPSIFIPSLVDISTQQSIITKGMTELSEMGIAIKNLESEEAPEFEIETLKTSRKNKSVELQQLLFEQYVFLNNKGESKSLLDIFKDRALLKPPAGAGDCAAPKLLQYAYLHKMKPLAITEFWWGQPNPSDSKLHKNYYPACENKCRPILEYMLGNSF